MGLGKKKLEKVSTYLLMYLFLLAVTIYIYFLIFLDDLDVKMNIKKRSK